jgi:hypothetical protein
MTIDAGTWPELPWREWEPTISTLHVWVQIVGKVRLALAPPLNHLWQVALYVSARGLTTSPIPYRESVFQVDFDFVDQRLRVTDGNPGSFTMALEPRSPAQFYREFMAGLKARGIDVAIWPQSVEMAEAIRFDKDERDGAYDPKHAELLWRALVQVDRVMKSFQTGFVGKASPVSLFWGGFDLAAIRAGRLRAIRAAFRTAPTGSCRSPSRARTSPPAGGLEPRRQAQPSTPTPIPSRTASGRPPYARRRPTSTPARASSSCRTRRFERPAILPNPCANSSSRRMKPARIWAAGIAEPLSLPISRRCRRDGRGASTADP